MTTTQTTATAPRTECPRCSLRGCDQVIGSICPRCVACDDTGQRFCPLCEGSGTADHGLDVPCPSCKGRSVVACWRC